MNRRSLLVGSAAVGGGLVLGINFSRAADGTEGPPGALEPNAWLRITPDDRVTFQLDKVEMGQGVLTALPTILGEELDVDPRRIFVELAPIHAQFQDPMQMTGGSTSMASRWVPLRRTGAQARTMLVAAAAARWGIAPSACRTQDGRVLQREGDASFSYGELAVEAAALPVPEAPVLKQPQEFAYIGKPLRRFDAQAKSTGAATFGIDVDLPDMVTAVVLRNPHFGGALASVEAADARRAAGVVDVFPIATGVAVVADTYWHARKAAALVQVQWQTGALVGVNSAGIRDAFVALSRDEGRELRGDGDSAAAEAVAAEKTAAGQAGVLEAVYEVPYLAHATMEPQNTTASFKDGVCEVWSPTQGADIAQALIADALDIGRENVIVHTTLMGGGFGRRGIPDFAVEAALIARQIGKPVKVIWSREDDMRHDFYRPATFNVLRAALNERGEAQSWSHTIVAPSMMRSLVPAFTALAPEWVPEWMADALGGAARWFVRTRDATSHEGAANHPYAIANVRVSHVFHDPGVPLGFWRSVGHSQNAFVVESFIDELAHRAQADPLAYRRQLLAGHPRHLRVLDLVAEKASWGSPAEGLHQGVAVHESFGSLVAEVAEVRIVDGRIRVERVVCAVDCGLVINADQVRAQVESAVIFGLTAALHGRITIEDGAVVQSNFHDYPLLTLPEAPRIDVHMVPGGEAPSGIGEPGTPPIAPAVANAVFRATGQRLRSLPLTLSAT